MAILRRRPPASRILNPGASAYRSANALTASGARVNAKKQGDDVRRLVQPWQSRAFAYYDMLGEIKYAAQFYSRGLSQLRLFPAVMKDGELVETDDPQAVDALARVQDPGGGRTALLSAYGRLMFLTGESILFVSKNPETDMEQWEMLSSDELRIQGGTYLRVKAPSLQAENYKDLGEADFEPVGDTDAVAYRLWQRHPRYSQLADSTMQGVLDLCEELVLLTQSVRARAKSRLAGSGVLFIDDRVSPPPPEPVGDEDPEADPFVKDLVDAMTTPIVDEGAASSVVPLVVRMPTDETRPVKDLVYHLQIVDPMQLYPETGLRYECIKRIAIGLDMPVEILMGLGDANHWSAWQVDEQTWKGHLQPKAQQLVDDLSAAYFRPQLKADGVTNWGDFYIGYDAAAIINHPDRTKDAKDLHKSLAISDASLRDAAGFDDSDAITDPDEMTRRIGVAVNDGVLAVTGHVSDKEDLSRATAADDTIDAGTSSAEAVKEPPEPPGERDDSSLVSAATVARVLGAADLSLLRAREAAGNRIRSLAKRDPKMLEAIDGVRPGQVAAILGRDRVRSLNGSEAALVAGCRDLIADALRVYGIADEDLVERVVQAVEQHAVRTLYQERPGPLPSTFTNYVAGLLG